MRLGEWPLIVSALETTSLQVIKYNESSGQSLLTCCCEAVTSQQAGDIFLRVAWPLAELDLWTIRFPQMEGVRRVIRFPLESLVTPSHTSWPVVCSSGRTGLKGCLYIPVFSSHSCIMLKDMSLLDNSHIFWVEATIEQLDPSWLPKNNKWLFYEAT